VYLIGVLSSDLMSKLNFLVNCSHVFHVLIFVLKVCDYIHFLNAACVLVIDCMRAILLVDVTLQYVCRVLLFGIRRYGKRVENCCVLLQQDRSDHIVDTF